MNACGVTSDHSPPGVKVPSTVWKIVPNGFVVVCAVTAAVRTTLADATIKPVRMDPRNAAGVSRLGDLHSGYFFIFLGLVGGVNLTELNFY